MTKETQASNSPSEPSTPSGDMQNAGNNPEDSGGPPLAFAPNSRSAQGKLAIDEKLNKRTVYGRAAVTRTGVGVVKEAKADRVIVKYSWGWVSAPYEDLYEDPLPHVMEYIRGELRRGKECIAEKQLDTALSVLQAAVSFIPYAMQNDSHIRQLLGELYTQIAFCHLNEEQYDHALHCSQLAVGFQPSSIIALLRCGQAHSRMGNLEEAALTLMKAARLRPMSVSRTLHIEVSRELDTVMERRLLCRSKRSRGSDKENPSWRQQLYESPDIAAKIKIRRMSTDDDEASNKLAAQTSEVEFFDLQDPDIARSENDVLVASTANCFESGMAFCLHSASVVLGVLQSHRLLVCSIAAFSTGLALGKLVASSRKP